MIRRQERVQPEAKSDEGIEERESYFFPRIDTNAGDAVNYGGRHREQTVFLDSSPLRKVR